MHEPLFAPNEVVEGSTIGFSERVPPALGKRRKKAITRRQYITCIPSNNFTWKNLFKIIKMKKKIAKKSYKAM